MPEFTWIRYHCVEDRTEDEHLHHFETNHRFRFEGSFEKQQHRMTVEWVILLTCYYSGRAAYSLLRIIDESDWSTQWKDFGKVCHRMPMAKKRIESRSTQRESLLTYVIFISIEPCTGMDQRSDGTFHLFSR